MQPLIKVSVTFIYFVQEKKRESGTICISKLIGPTKFHISNELVRKKEITRDTVNPPIGFGKILTILANRCENA